MTASKIHNLSPELSLILLPLPPASRFVKNKERSTSAAQNLNELDKLDFNNGIAAALRTIAANASQTQSPSARHAETEAAHVSPSRHEHKTRKDAKKKKSKKRRSGAATARGSQDDGDEEDNDEDEPMSTPRRTARASKPALVSRSSSSSGSAAKTAGKTAAKTAAKTATEPSVAPRAERANQASATPAAAPAAASPAARAPDATALDDVLGLSPALARISVMGANIRRNDSSTDEDKSEDDDDDDEDDLLCSPLLGDRASLCFAPSLTLRLWLIRCSFSYTLIRQAQQRKLRRQQLLNRRRGVGPIWKAHVACLPGL